MDQAPPPQSGTLFTICCTQLGALPVITFWAALLKITEACHTEHAAVGVAVGVLVGVAVGVAVGVGVGVRVGVLVGVAVAVAVEVAVGVGVGVTVDVRVGVGVADAVAVTVAVGVADDFTVAVGLGVGVADGVAVTEGAGVAVKIGGISSGIWAVCPSRDSGRTARKRNEIKTKARRKFERQCLMALLLIIVRPEIRCYHSPRSVAAGPSRGVGASHLGT